MLCKNSVSYGLTLRSSVSSPSAAGSIRNDGSIGGFSHPNESRWQVQDAALIFSHPDGRETTRFDTFRKDQGQWVISRPFLLKIEVIHALSQIAGPLSSG
jgi:hypothetical protein